MKIGKDKYTMTPEMKTPKKRKVFYGWFALAGLALVVFTVSGAFINSFGVFLPVICEDLEWSRAVVAMALSIGIMSFGLPSPLFGLLVTRFGPRFTIIWGNLVAAAAIAGISLVHEIWQFYLLYSIIGIGGGFGGYIACSTIANNWFIKKRSLALGIFVASGGLGGFVFPPVATAMIAAIGWRLSWVVMAGIVAIGAIVGGVILIRNRPEDIGLVPDGVEPGPFDEIDVIKTAVPEKEASVGLRQMLKTPVIWMIAGFAVANAFVIGTMNTHQVAYIQDIGFPPMTAATTMSVLAAVGVTGSVSFGASALKLNVKKLGITAFSCQLIALVILLTTKQLGLIYIYAILLGLGYGALTTAMPTFVGIYFGREIYARALGLILPFQVGAQAVAAYVAGVIYDAAGSYTPAFIVVASCIAAGFFIMTMMRLPKRQ
jgi:sugar phosphate permease